MKTEGVERDMRRKHHKGRMKEIERGREGERGRERQRDREIER